MLRVRSPRQRPRLVVQGPGRAHVVHDFDDLAACAIQQSEIERQLVARDFRLLRFEPRPRPRPTPPSPPTLVAC